MLTLEGYTPSLNLSAALLDGLFSTALPILGQEDRGNKGEDALAIGSNELCLHRTIRVLNDKNSLHDGMERTMVVVRTGR